MFTSLRLTGALLVACAFAPLASAQIIFTVTAQWNGVNANGSSYGYTPLTDYTFVFTLNSSVTEAALSAGSTFDGTSNFWAEYHSAQASLFSGVSGTGLQGTYVPTAVSPDTLNAFVSAYSPAAPSYPQSGELSFSANRDNDPDLANGGYLTDYDGQTGLKMADGTSGISSVYLSFAPTSTDANFLSTGFDSQYVSPNVFWRNNLVLSSGASGNVYLTPYGEASSITLNVTGISITDATAVPEPATYASLLGVAGLAFALRRRRRASA